MINQKKYIKDISKEELTELIIQYQLPKFRISQIYNGIFSGKARSFIELTNLSKKERELLAGLFHFDSLDYETHQVSSDGSTKFLYKTKDFPIETVFMPYDNIDSNRTTLCVSTMTGCPLACTFCATGSMTKSRNLTKGEILDQIYLTEQIVGQKITNIVFMGMGEPLLNFDNLISSIGVINDENLLSISSRKITVSTVGIPNMIKKLASIEHPPKLAISLHATTDGMRSEIMPSNKKYGMKDILADCEFYYRNTKKSITFEYILFKNFNDSIDDVQRLAKIAKRVPSKINLIPFNNIPNVEKKINLIPASENDILYFQNQLKLHDIPTIVRNSMGSDIAAACGQLVLLK